nr:caspase family protein [Rhizobium sp. L1K21]
MVRICTSMALALTMAAGTTGQASAATGKRVALVIGNGTYAFANHLPNPPRDADLFANTIRAAGFEVIEGLDVNKNDMQSLIDRFTEAAYDADVALVYYAGHGMQVEGKNYLIPVDAQLMSPAHLQTRTIQMDDIVSALPNDPAIGVILIDACRDNPLARTFAASLPATRSVAVNSGLAPIQTTTNGDGTGGLLIGYATDPGAVALDGDGENSPYTQALVRHLAEPGVNIQSALTRVRGDVVKATGGRQRPWYNASLGREVFLGEEVEVASLAPESTSTAQQTYQEMVPSAPAVAGVDKDWEIESSSWDQVVKANTEEHYEFFIKSFPNSRFRPLAELNLKQLQERKNTQVASLSSSVGDAGAQIARTLPGQLEPTVLTTPGTPLTEEAIGMSRNDKLDLQLRLTALNFDTKGADGSLGRNSRLAISAWQTSRGIVETGYLTGAQYAALKNQSEPYIAQAYRDYEAKKAAQQTRSAKSSSGRKTKSKGSSDFGNAVGKVIIGAGTLILACKITNSC